MNNIQEYIDLLKSRKEKAQEDFDNTNIYDNDRFYNQGQLHAFSFALHLAELLLLNKPTVAITETAHSANTMLSEVPTSEDGQVIGVVGADSSETEIVKQNEQKINVCKHINGGFVGAVGQVYCDDCRSWVEGLET